MEIHARMVHHVLHWNKDDSNAIACQDGRDNRVKLMSMIVLRIHVCWVPTVLIWLMTSNAHAHQGKFYMVFLFSKLFFEISFNFFLCVQFYRKEMPWKDRFMLVRTMCARCLCWSSVQLWLCLSSRLEWPKLRHWYQRLWRKSMLKWWHMRWFSRRV